MAKVENVRPHGTGIRGFNLSRASVLFEGPFGRIFRSLPPADFGADDNESVAALSMLADKMIAAPDPVKNGPDPEESGIPAAYTYFGQFIDHDLTFDPASSLQKQNDPDALEDYRTPRFDLDNVYGRGPDDQPYLYDSTGRLFLLGSKLTGTVENPNARDLIRSIDETGKRSRAIIGDPRNDENVIVSQLQGLLHRLHNKFATENPSWPFQRVQRELRFHYQWVVLNDFLPTVVSSTVLNAVVPHLSKGTNIVKDEPDLRFFHPKNAAFMPLEFAAAAYRLGHSMVRPGYQLSETIGPLAIFESDPNKALTGFREFPSSWAIDWSMFIDLKLRPPGSDDPKDPGNKSRMQLAYRIDTSLVNPLGNLPESVAAKPLNILALRNLLRGWRMRLPNGQTIARAMGLRPLKDSEILIGKFTGDPADIIGSIDTIHPAFKENCPLWTYVLAETVKSGMAVHTSTGDIQMETRKLGPVGGRIVAETFVGILLADSSSYLSLDPLWKPAAKFGLRELIAKALS